MTKTRAQKYFYDRKQTPPIELRITSGTNTTGRSEAVYENERTKIKCNEEKVPLVLPSITMFTRMVNTLESIGHNIFGEDDNEYYDNDEETRRQRRNDEMVVRDVQNAREFAQFIRDEGALTVSLIVVA